jgi:hypothetical protein
VRAIEEVVRQIKEAVVSTGLVINERKTKRENKQKHNKFTARSENGQTSI